MLAGLLLESVRTAVISCAMSQARSTALSAVLCVGNVSLSTPMLIYEKRVQYTQLRSCTVDRLAADSLLRRTVHVTQRFAELPTYVWK